MNLSKKSLTNLRRVAYNSNVAQKDSKVSFSGTGACTGPVFLCIFPLFFPFRQHQCVQQSTLQCNKMLENKDLMPYNSTVLQIMQSGQAIRILHPLPKAEDLGLLLFCLPACIRTRMGEGKV